MTDPDDPARDDGTRDDGTGPGDALEHLRRAAHELLAAARVVIDTADGLVEGLLRSEPDERPPRVRRIDVEER